jgi:hypothetical protein
MRRVSDPETPALELEARRSGKRWRVTAMVNGEVAHVNVFDPAIATQRAKFIENVKARFPEVCLNGIEAELLQIGVESGLPGPPAAGPGPEADPLASTPANVLAEAERMLLDPELIRRVCDDVGSLGVAGERDLALNVYLIGVSRLLDKPLAGIVRGSSSSGKSFLVEKVASLFPPETVILATQMTPQALFHMPQGSLRNKWVVAGERSRKEDDDRAEATRALREMLSSGRLTKLMPEKVGGVIQTEIIEQEGPIAFIETTTLSNIFEEDANRCLILQTDESQEQTRRIVAELAGRHSTPGPRTNLDYVRSVHHAIQRMLPTVDVRVPFAERISRSITCDRVEVRRAFRQLLALIQASALLHFRQRKMDDGVLLATATDYQIARRLILKPFGMSLGGGVSDAAHRYFDWLKKRWAKEEFESSQAINLELGKKSATYGWLAELHNAGALERLEKNRGNRSARWRLTGNDPLPGAGIIPEVEDVVPEYRNRGHNGELPEPEGV